MATSERSSFSRWRALLVAMRPHQWAKNLLVFLPLVLSHNLTDRRRLTAAIIAFVAFCLCASGGYIFNDLLDLESDRQHPTKRLRPFAARRASIAAGIAIAVAAASLSFTSATVFLPLSFVVLLALYAILTTAYSLWLKRRLLVDVIVLAGLYTLRIIAGAHAIQVPLTMWLLAFSMFLFLSLAFVKRYSELIEVEDLGGEKISGRGYTVSDLRIIEGVGPASGYLSVVVFCNYLNSDMARSLYRHPQVLWLLAPVLLYWITRIWFVARRRSLHEDPIIYALQNRVSQLTGLLAVVIVLAAWLPLPRWWPL